MIKHPVKPELLVLILSIMIIASFAAYASSLPTNHLIPLQGIAKDSSGQLLETGDVTVRIYDSGESLVYSSDFADAINNGKFDILLGSSTALLLDNTQSYYMEIDVNGEEIIGDAAGGRQEFWPGSGDHSHDESWNDLLDIPVGFADGTDDVGDDWNSLTNVPAGFADDVDDTGDSLWTLLGSDVYYHAGNVGIGTISPSEKLEVGGNILAIPIVGKWYPTATDIGAGYWEWDAQRFNTNTDYFGWTAGDDKIIIKKPGYYQVCANLMYSGLTSGDKVSTYFYRNDYRFFIDGGYANGYIIYTNSCVTFNFAADDTIKMENPYSDNDRYGSGNGLHSHMTIYRLN